MPLGELDNLGRQRTKSQEKDPFPSFPNTCQFNPIGLGKIAPQGKRGWGYHELHLTLQLRNMVLKVREPNASASSTWRVDLDLYFEAKSLIAPASAGLQGGCRFTTLSIPFLGTNSGCFINKIQCSTSPASQGSAQARGYGAVSICLRLSQGTKPSAKLSLAWWGQHWPQEWDLPSTSSGATLPTRNLMFYSALRSSRRLDPLHEENWYHISHIMSDQSDHLDLAPEVAPWSSPPPIKEVKIGISGSWCSSTHPYPISLFQVEQAASCPPWGWLFLSAESTWEAKTSLALPWTCRLAACVFANVERKTMKNQPKWLTRVWESSVRRLWEMANSGRGDKRAGTKHSWNCSEIRHLFSAPSLDKFGHPLIKKVAQISP